PSFPTKAKLGQPQCDGIGKAESAPHPSNPAKGGAASAGCPTHPSPWDEWVAYNDFARSAARLRTSMAPTHSKRANEWGTRPPMRILARASWRVRPQLKRRRKPHELKACTIASEVPWFPLPVSLSGLERQ